MQFILSADRITKKEGESINYQIQQLQTRNTVAGRLNEAEINQLRDLQLQKKRIDDDGIEQKKQAIIAFGQQSRRQIELEKQLEIEKSEQMARNLSLKFLISSGFDSPFQAFKEVKSSALIFSELFGCK